MTASVVRARERYVEWYRAKARIAELDTTQKRLLERERVLDERVGREARDVERLHGLSLQALFHTILGDKPEALAKERRELLAAELERDGVRERIAEAERQRAEIQARLTVLGDASMIAYQF